MINKYQKHNKDAKKEAHERYQNLSEEEKDNRQKKVQDRYQNVPEEKSRNYLSIWKNII